MTRKVAERLVWAVETLAVDPADHLLEIGCGHGVAVSLICEKLATGSISAIDRSEAMIAMARKRNRKHVSSGRAEFQATALGEADFDDERFDKIFAVNVSLFWKQPAGELAIIKKLLTRGGAVYIFHQPPVERKTHDSADRMTKILRANGFSIRKVEFEDLRPVVAVCVMAEAS